MDYNEGKTIEDLVIQTLQKGSLLSVELIAVLKKQRIGTTNQGVYRVLRKLEQEEKITIHGKSVSLNVQWLRRMADFFSVARYEYSTAKDDTGFLGVKEKEKISYSFKNLIHLDVFLGQAFYMFSQTVPTSVPAYIYNPHEWFAYGRGESEQFLIDALIEQQRPVLITVAHSDPLDREIARTFNQGIFQYHMAQKAPFKKDNYYVTVFGPYLIEATIDERSAMEIDKLFKNTVCWNKTAKKQMGDIINRPGRNKLVISRNQKKAEKYRKILAKDFFIAKKK